MYVPAVAVPEASGAEEAELAVLKAFRGSWFEKGQRYVPRAKSTEPNF